MTKATAGPAEGDALRRLIERAYELVVGAQIRETKRERERDLQDARVTLEAALAPLSGPVDNEVTRFEVIDESGRTFVRWGCTVELSYQDQGRTLKVFVTDNPAAPKGPKPGWLTPVLAAAASAAAGPVDAAAVEEP